MFQGTGEKSKYNTKESCSQQGHGSEKYYNIFRENSFMFGL